MHYSLRHCCRGAAGWHFVGFCSKSVQLFEKRQPFLKQLLQTAAVQICCKSQQNANQLQTAGLLLWLTSHDYTTDNVYIMQAHWSLLQ